MLSSVIAENKLNTANPNKHEFNVKNITFLLSNEKRFFIIYFNSDNSNYFESTGYSINYIKLNNKLYK